MFEKIKRWYFMGLWTERQVQQAREKGVISNSQMEEILNN